jgi:hypothetical protein
MSISSRPSNASICCAISNGSCGGSSPIRLPDQQTNTSSTNIITRKPQLCVAVPCTEDSTKSKLGGMLWLVYR